MNLFQQQLCFIVYPLEDNFQDLELKIWIDVKFA